MRTSRSLAEPISWKREWKYLLIVFAVFLGIYYLPVDDPGTGGALFESLRLAKWYAREHVLLCLVPAFFIAGAIAVFVRQTSVVKYLGAGANKFVAYGVASVSGSILAVCSCTVLPLFAGIYRRGAGLGPATAFLYSGPAVNVLAIVLTARVLGLELGVARAVGAIVFSVVIGLFMSLIFREKTGKNGAATVDDNSDGSRPLWMTAFYFASMVGVLVFANWGVPAGASGMWSAVFANKWAITAVFALAFAVMLAAWFGAGWRWVAAAAIPVALLALLLPERPGVAFVAGIVGVSIVIAARPGELREWFDASWQFGRQILPLLLVGVLIAGALLGSSGAGGLIPSEWVARAVGGNSIAANLFASVAGAFMYFATLTEVPILEGLIGAGMGKGPALALLLAGPALSLPNMLVIRSVIGWKKTIVYIVLVVAMATISGVIFGLIAA
jgi:uncharacterized membrane protein YraQ (UPF0718 family)